MPLKDGQSIGLFDSHEALAADVLRLIDDFDTLNQRQIAAYDACAARFDWDRIGQHLLGHIRRTGRRQGRSPAVSAVARAITAEAD